MFDNFDTLRQQVERNIADGLKCGGAQITEDRHTITVIVKPPSSFRGAARIQKTLREEGFSSESSGIYVLNKSKVHDYDVETINISEIDLSKIKSLEAKVFLKNHMDSNGNVDVNEFKSSLNGIIKGIQEDMDVVKSSVFTDK